MNQGDFENAVSKAIQGGPSPVRRQMRGRFPDVVTFAGEKVRWLGKATTDQIVFGGGQYSTYDTLFGITLIHYATQPLARDVQVTTYPLSGVKGYDATTGKFERGLGRTACDQVVRASDDRVPVPATALWYLAYKPEKAVGIALAGVRAAPVVQRTAAPPPCTAAAAPPAGAGNRDLPLCILAHPASRRLSFSETD